METHFQLMSPAEARDLAAKLYPEEFPNNRFSSILKALPWSAEAESDSTETEAAASLSVRFGSYFYPVLAPALQWEFRSSDSNRCIKCNEDLRWGFGPLPFKSFHPDRLGCRCHCTALGVPEKAPKEDARWL